MSNVPGREAITIFNRYSFFHLYPYIFSIDFDENSHKLLSKVKPLSFKTLPWILSITLISVVCELGSFVLLLLAPFFSIRLNYEVYHIVIFILLGICCCFQIFTTCTILKHREIFDGFNALLQITERSKICFKKSQII